MFGFRSRRSWISRAVFRFEFRLAARSGSTKRSSCRTRLVGAFLEPLRRSLRVAGKGDPGRRVPGKTPPLQRPIMSLMFGCGPSFARKSAWSLRTAFLACWAAARHREPSEANAREPIRISRFGCGGEAKRSVRRDANEAVSGSRSPAENEAGRFGNGEPRLLVFGDRSSPIASVRKPIFRARKSRSYRRDKFAR